MAAFRVTQGDDLRDLGPRESPLWGSVGPAVGQRVMLVTDVELLGAGAHLGGGGLRSVGEDGMKGAGRCRLAPGVPASNRALPWRWEIKEEAFPSQGYCGQHSSVGPSQAWRQVQPPGAECPGRPGHEPSCGAADRLQADAGPCRNPPSGSHVLPGSREGDGQDTSPRALRGTGRGSPSPRLQPPLCW